MEGQIILDSTVITRILQRPSGRHLLALYVEEAGGMLQTLETAVSHANPQLIREAAHSLKSSSAYVGAVHVNTLSAALEQLGRQEQLETADLLFNQLCGEFERVKESIRQLENQR